MFKNAVTIGKTMVTEDSANIVIEVIRIMYN